MDLQTLFGIKFPIIQAPMAGAQGSAMAIAVSKAGGLGSLPCAMLSPDAMRRELELTRAQTGGVFNANFFCHAQPVVNQAVEARWKARLTPYYKEFGVDPLDAAPVANRLPFDAAAAKLVAEFRPAVVSFHFGLPSDSLLEMVRASGAKIVSSATTVDEALWLEKRGVDAIIAQGLEAGGHRGMFLSDDLGLQMGATALVQELVKRVKVPVIAAGGIVDARGVQAAMELGAAGVQIGTAYLLCPESTISPMHRAALMAGKTPNTALTNVFSGRLARGILNRAMLELGPVGKDVPPFPLASTAMAPLRAKAESQGSGDFSPLWSGQDASGCRAVSAYELTEMLASTSSVP